MNQYSFILTERLDYMNNQTDHILQNNQKGPFKARVS